jgi:hypothetical protein
VLLVGWLRVLPENDLATFCFPSLIFGFGFGFGFGRRRCRREFQNYSSHTPLRAASTDSAP